MFAGIFSYSDPQRTVAFRGAPLACSARRSWRIRFSFRPAAPNVAAWLNRAGRGDTRPGSRPIPFSATWKRAKHLRRLTRIRRIRKKVGTDARAAKRDLIQAGAGDVFFGQCDEPIRASKGGCFSNTGVHNTKNSVLDPIPEGDGCDG